MDRQELQQLRDLPIEGVAEKLGLKVSQHKSLCPFHDDHHASLSFNVRKNTYRCFVCGEHGGTIDLVMRFLHKDFREACEWLGGDGIQFTVYRLPSPSEPKAFDAQRYEKFFERPWLSPEARRFLFDERRLDERVVRWCRLTSWRDRQGVNWLQIPYYDREGRLVGLQNRNLQKGAQPRFRFPQGAECGIYNLPVLGRLHEGEPLYITEGCSDCWAALSAGHKAIAIPSATLLKKKDLDELLTLNSQLLTPFHMYPDRDEPGERLFLQLQRLLPNLTHHQLPLGCKDYSEYYVKFKV
ncbi:MAG: hypothetical protein J6V98_00780 [Bacteroidales bacterium]|nr:hypothetical protein [Bacteroidales bacterium]